MRAWKEVNRKGNGSISHNQIETWYKATASKACIAWVKLYLFLLLFKFKDLFCYDIEREEEFV